MQYNPFIYFAQNVNITCPQRFREAELIKSAFFNYSYFFATKNPFKMIGTQIFFFLPYRQVVLKFWTKKINKG